jgi:hypothetical protein
MSFAGAQEWRYRRCQATPNQRWELSQESQAGRNNFHNTEVKISYKSDLPTLLCLLKIISVKLKVITDYLTIGLLQ